MQEPNAKAWTTAAPVLAYQKRARLTKLCPQQQYFCPIENEIKIDWLLVILVVTKTT